MRDCGSSGATRGPAMQVAMQEESRSIAHCYVVRTSYCCLFVPFAREASDGRCGIDT